MPVHIEVGHGLDGGIARQAETSIGRMVLVPQRLLGWLETRFGLELPETSFSVRALKYLACLRECDSADRFFHRSLQQDEMGVAGELLKWRDTWYEAGWNGGPFRGAVSNRLEDMAAVEELAKDRVPPGIGQRVQRLLPAVSESPVGLSVSSLDPLETYPTVWRTLFQVLGVEARPWTPRVTADPTSDLGLLQSRLLDPASDAEPIQLNGDGTVLVLRDGSPHQSSHWVSRYAHNFLQDSAPASAVVLSEHAGVAFDDALTEAGLPRLGFAEPSIWRPVFQVLPMALELLWSPLNPKLLLQFLSHPMGPVKGGLRARLARAVADQPGIGGEKWREAVEEGLDRAVAEADAGKVKEVRQRHSSALEFWVESDRHDPEEGAPIGLVMERVDGTSRWLGSTGSFVESETETSLFRIALNQSSELSSALEQLQHAGSDRIGRDDLRRLLEAVRGSGSPRPDVHRQCQDAEPQLLRATSPSAVVHPTPLVVWFGLDEVGVPRAEPWSRAEREQLAANGIELVPLDARLEWEAGSWLRPIFSASKQLTLVMHDSAEGHHPVFDQISAGVRGWREMRIDDLVRAQDGKMPGDVDLPGCALPPVEVLEIRPLPPKTRWWRINPPENLGPRERESYSSLEKFLYGPYQWVLDYKARLRPGVLSDVDDGNRLKGTLAHGLFERFFENGVQALNSSDSEIRGWARKHLREMIETQGAVLLEPGRQTEREDFMDTSARALVQLVERLRKADVVDVEMEVRQTGTFVGGDLHGYIDLLATNAKGEQAVVDIKWGGIRYRRKSLEESGYLQLAVYASLCRERSQRWPALAYFIISDGRMLAPNTDFFPGAEAVPPANEEGVEELWRRVAATWNWRRRQLDAGLVEVAVEGTAPVEDSEPGEGALVIPETYDHFNDFKVLTGWDASS